ncbi:protein kinase [Herpetosiphon gulosus]|uniref:Serine/threonine-protein kinase PknD n=1 Tax=Herpetosiphon gulosus TaxID=1973496 RepID=A0ABP9X8T5_9CHLR
MNHDTQWIPLIDPGDYIDEYNEYQIVNLIQAGGCGCVYLVRAINPDANEQISLDTIRKQYHYGLNVEHIRKWNLAALKIARPDGKYNYTTHIVDEHRYLQMINHSSVVSLYRNPFRKTTNHYRGEYKPVSSKKITSTNGVSYDYKYIIMNFECGGSLQSYLQEIQRPLNQYQVVGLIIQIANVLNYLHKNIGIVHRDITPKNILFRNPISMWRYTIPEIVLIDFGCIETLNHKYKLRSIPFTTFPYGAPEIEKNMNAHHMNDIYSLGIIFYELLAGFSINNKVILSLDQVNSKINKDLASIVMDCINPDVNERNKKIGSAEELIKKITLFSDQKRSGIKRKTPNYIKIIAVIIIALIIILSIILSINLIQIQSKKVDTLTSIPSITSLPLATPSPLPTAKPTTTRIPQP